GRGRMPGTVQRVRRAGALLRDVHRGHRAWSRAAGAPGRPRLGTAGSRGLTSTFLGAPARAGGFYEGERAPRVRPPTLSPSSRRRRGGAVLCLVLRSPLTPRPRRRRVMSAMATEALFAPELLSQRALPHRFGRYVLFDRVGRGGMAEVF